MSEQLRIRMEALGAGPATADWADARGRTGRVRRRRTTLALAAGAAALAVTVPALAVATGEVDFWKAEPANPRVELAFDEMARHFPAGAERLRVRESRKVLTRTFGEGVLTKGAWTLSIGLRTDGDICTFIQGPRSGVADCYGGGPPETLTTSGVGGEKDLDGVLVGTVRHPDAGYVEIALGGGRVKRAELTRVAEPIGAAFFMEQIDVWGDLGTVIVRKADGTRIASAEF